MAIPAADLVKIKALVCLGVVFIYLACVSTRLPRVLDKVATLLNFYVKHHRDTSCCWVGLMASPGSGIVQENVRV